MSITLECLAGPPVPSHMLDLCSVRASTPFPWEHPAAPRAAVTVDRLSVRRGGQEVLRDISLTFEEGAITAVVGPSGVGKTTLMGVLNGLITPVAGNISVAGIGQLHDAATLREARRRTATVFQDHALIGRLPAIENVLLGLADAAIPCRHFLGRDPSDNVQPWR